MIVFIKQLVRSFSIESPPFPPSVMRFRQLLLRKTTRPCRGCIVSVTATHEDLSSPEQCAEA